MVIPHNLKYKTNAFVIYYNNLFINMQYSIRIKYLLALRISELGKLDWAPKTTTFDPIVMKTTTHTTIKFF